MHNTKSNLRQDLKDDQYVEEQLQNYWNQREISGNLMAELRALIIKDFNKSRLGREIHLQQKREAVISPLELVIGAFVAEYLYAQGHHFSLSLLFAESNQIFPNFERNDHFRFQSNEINEILDAIGVRPPLKQSIADQYLAERHKFSLLHSFFKAALASRPVETEKNDFKSEIKSLQSELVALKKLVQDMGSVKQSVCLDTFLPNLTAINKNLDKLLTEPTEPESPSSKKVRFTDWVLELTASEMGKRYLKKLRRLVLRLIHKEKKKLKQKYRSRYKHKRPASPLVKQRPPPVVTMKTQSTETDPSLAVFTEHMKNLNSLVANKLSSLEIDEVGLQLKLQRLEDKLKHCESQTKAMTVAVQQRKLKRKSILVKSHSVDIPTISDPENVIKTIRNRINSLEAESEELFSSFKAYLDGKKQHNAQLTKEKVMAWQQLQEHRSTLEKYEKKQRLVESVVVKTISPPISDRTPTINLSTSTESKKSSPKEYRNPFYEIKLEAVLKQRAAENEGGRNIARQTTDAVRKHFNNVVTATTVGKRKEIKQDRLEEILEKENKPVNGQSEKKPQILENGNSILREEKKEDENLNETFLKVEENLKDLSIESEKGHSKSKEEAIPTSTPPKHTEVEVVVANRCSSGSSRSISGDKVAISTGNVSSIASDDFWD